MRVGDRRQHSCTRWLVRIAVWERQQNMKQSACVRRILCNRQLMSSVSNKQGARQKWRERERYLVPSGYNATWKCHLPGAFVREKRQQVLIQSKKHEILIEPTLQIPWVVGAFQFLSDQPWGAAHCMPTPSLLSFLLLLLWGGMPSASKDQSRTKTVLDTCLFYIIIIIILFSFLALWRNERNLRIHRQ